MAKIIQVKRGTTQQWNNYGKILKAGEPGLDIDVMRLKFGDGIHSWDALPYCDATDIVDDLSVINPDNATLYAGKAASARLVKMLMDRLASVEASDIDGGDLSELIA